MSSAIVPTSYGPKLLPSGVPSWDPGSAIGTQGLPVLPLSIAELPDIYGLIYGDGLQRMRHVVRSLTFPTGLIPPDDVDIPVVPGQPVTSEPVTPGGVVQPVFVYDPDGGGIRGTDSPLRTFNLFKGTGSSGKTSIFAMHIVESIGTADQFYNILRQTTLVDTLQVMADAINGNVSANWQEPNSTYIGDYSMGDVIAEVVDGTLQITYTNHPIMGWPNPDINETEIDLLLLYSNILEVELPTGTRHEPTVYGRSSAESSEPAQAYYAMWLDDPTNWALSTGVISLADTNSAAYQRAYFVITLVNAFTTADHTYQIKNGGTFSRQRIIDAIEDITYNGLAATHPDVQVPNTSDPNYQVQLGIGDIRFKGRGNWGGLWFRENAGASGNATWLYQSVSPTGINTPIPPSATWAQFAGGGDGYDVADGPNDTLGAGDYGYGWAWYRDIDKARSALGYRYRLVGHGGGPTGVVGWPTAEDPDVDFHRIFRTLLDGLGDYFKVDDVLVEDPQPEHADERSDFDIAGTFGSLLYNPRHYRSRAAGYPEAHRHLARHESAIWGAGLSRSAPHAGGCTWSNGADTVTIDAPIVPTHLWVGRYIRHPDFTKRYVIISVDTPNRKVKIGEPYEGESEAGNFICEDERAAYATHKAQENFHNQWPARPFEGTDGKHKDGITGLLARQQAIYAWTRSATWVITGSAAGGYAIEPISASVGLINQRCLITHEGMAYYLAGPAGFYQWDFRTHPGRISNPPFVDLGDPRGIQGTVDRINWDAAEWFHAVLDPDNRLIRWFVALDGSEYPNHVITYDLKGKSWGEDTCPPITSSCAILLPNGGWAVLSGDAEGRIWMHDVGDTDGAFGVEPNQVVDSATHQSITLTATVAVSLAGCPIMLNSATQGLQYVRVSRHVAGTDTVYLREALDWLPAQGDDAVLGAIDQWLEPNRFDAGVKDEEKMVPVTWVHFRKETEGEFYLWVWDQESESYMNPLFDSPVGDLSRAEGTERFRTNMRGHELGFRIRAFEPGYRPAFRRFELQMVVRAKPQQGT